MRSRQLVTVLFLAGTLLGAFSCGDDDGAGGLSTTKYAEIEVSPTSLVFSPLAVGESQTLTVTVKNSGSGDDLVLQQVYIRDEGVPYELLTVSAERIPMGDTALVQVKYTSVGENPVASVLMIDTNASNKPNGLVEVPLSVTAANTGLLIYPEPVDFGEVLGGESKTIHVTIENWATSTTSIVNTFLQPGSSEDFDQVLTPKYPISLAPGDKAIVDIVYTPTEGNSDVGTWVVVINEAGVQKLREVELLGKEVGPELSVSPPTLDFGWVAVNGSSTLELTVHNMGAHDLRIKSITMAAGSNGDLRVDDAPNAVAEIESGDKAVYHVTFAPTEYFAATSDPIGGVAIETNDNDEGLVVVPVYGNIDAPFIKVDPMPSVDFGIVAQNWEIPRTLTITNVGHAPLVIDPMEISDNSAAEEFVLDPDDEFGGTATLAADESINVTVTFTNLGAATGQEIGKLRIASNDPISSEVYVDLIASRGGAPECKLAFVPAKLEFGTVAHGGDKTLPMFVKNTGSGYCSWKSGMIKECTSWMGLMTQCSDNNGPSDNFIPMGMPIPIKDGIAPGTSQPIQVHYVPPTTIPFIPMFEEYHAVLQVHYTEPYSSADGTYVEHVMPEPTSTGTLNWNIHGTSGVADIAVLPPYIEFGLVTIGCYSQTKCVKVYNAGTAPLDISDVYLDSCGPEFQIKSLPALPIMVAPSSYEEVCAVYLPQNEGLDSCNMVIESSDLDTPVVKIPLTGEGTWETENTEFFTQISGRKVDILFVVDESASMCGEQDNLKTNMNALTSIAQTWDNDFQMGVVTTNIDEGYEMIGKFHGSPRILTNATVSAFGGITGAIGCDGSGAQESGLEAGRRALTPPNITNTTTPCTCAADQLCPQNCMEGELCVGGFCGGWNRGFLRDDASLEVVFLSDEEDQSPGSVPFYIDFYMSIKGYLNTNLFHAHAIVGDEGQGCGDNSGSSDGADAGERYIAVQEATGGKFGSICDDNYSSTLSDIGEIAFGLQIQFFLSAQADSSPGSIRVWLDRGNGFQECTSGWEFNQATNSIVFNEAGSCMPVAGDEIKVWYKMVCYTE